MNNNRKQQHTVLFGDELNLTVPKIPTKCAVCILDGVNGKNEKSYIPIDEDTLSKHIMLLGGIGTGKTNAFYHIISQLNEAMSEDDIMIIFDTKGDFYREFYCPGDVVISNDETATGSNYVDYWNIFNEIENGERQLESIIEISKALFAEACEKTNQIFFPNAAKDLFMGILLHFLRTAEPRHRTNKNLLAFINSVSASELKDVLASHNDLKGVSSYIANDDTPQTQGVISELHQIIREVFIGNFAKNGTLSLKDLVLAKGGKRVFIEYDISIGKMLSPVYSLMFDMAIKAALGRKHSKGNVYFITDEFKLLPNLEHIDDAVNFGRSLGIKFMIGIQNVEQIYDNYGEERARSIMSGFSTNIIFRVNDSHSREYVQDFFGKNQKLETYIPTIQSKGLIENQREGHVVEDWDVSNLRIGEAIIGMPNVEPFKFRFNEYITNEKE